MYLSILPLFSAGQLPTRYPTLFDYLFDLEKKLWIPTKMLVPQYVHNCNKIDSEILVPTVDTVRTTYFLDLINKIQKPLILIGETGVSKTTIVNEFLQNLDTETFVSKSIVCFLLARNVIVRLWLLLQLVIIGIV